ncbi:MAG: glycosyltransferase [SAR324 cluster bacterium]|nr:glycosyltransferase [SAR324 cluster bacterium]
MAAAAANRESLAELEVAIVHYWFLTWRGGEKVVESLMQLFPKADIYTLFYDPETCGEHLAGHQIYTSKIDTPFYKKNHQKFFPLYASGVESLKLQKKYDLILSSESGPAKGINRGPLNGDTPHVCYTHSPMRYCYGFEEIYTEKLPFLIRPIVSNQLARLRRWDMAKVDNVDLYIANSVNVQKRIKKYWDKDSLVAYPPIAMELFENDLQQGAKNYETKEYYLSFGAITPYKKVDLLVEVFNKSGKKLVIIGNGSEKSRLEKIAKDNITFCGFQSDAEVQKWLHGAKALLFPGEEDFGMIPLEAMSQGLPVIAYGAGGALETVVENRSSPDKSSGIFFTKQRDRELAGAISDFEKIEKHFEPEWIRSHARGFAEDVFLRKISGKIYNFIEDQK